MNNPVLLIIDMLNDFFRSGPLAERRPELTKSINQLISLFRARGWPIIWVRQEFAADLSDAFLSMRDNETRITMAGTPGCEILSELDYKPSDTVIVKKRYSAFFGTNLDELLKSLKPDTVVATGINSHACVRTTVIDAYQRDYRVVIAKEGVASWDEKHHQVSMGYLENVVKVMTHDEIYAAADR